MSKQGSILIVDDNEELLVALKMQLHEIFKVIDTINHPRKLLKQLNSNDYDLVLLDMNYDAAIPNGNEGLYWMERVFEHSSAPSVVLITAYSDIEPAVQGIKKGAADFILKSWDSNKIFSTIQTAYRLHCSKRKIQTLQQKQAQIGRAHV